MIAFNIKDDLKRLTKDLQKQQHKVIPRSTVQAINKTTSKVKSHAVREISKTTAIKQKVVRPRIAIQKASLKRQQGIVDARKGKARNLIEFMSKTHAKPSGGIAKPQFFRRRHAAKGKHKGAFRFQGVQAKAWGKKKVYDGAFVGRTSRGRVIVFKRTGKSRDKVTPVSGPSIRRSFISSQLTKSNVSLASVTFDKELSRALKLNLSRL